MVNLKNGILAWEVASLPVITEEVDDPDRIEEPVAPETSSAPEPPTTPTRSSSSSYSGSSSKSSDNMRGFDPASENDMDDNGMGRYMDNNDDEGWD